MNFATIKKNFNRGLWSAEMVKLSVKKGIITREQYEEITELQFYEITPQMSLEKAKAAKLKEIEYARYKAEVGGVEYLGVRMHTDRDSQAKYTGAVVAYQAAGTLPPSWKGIDGWLEISDAATLMGLATVVAQHVDACFVKEKELSNLVEAAETVEEVQAVAWE